METIIPNPSVFPYIENPYTKSGISLRDYFAGLAIQGLITNPNIKRPEQGVSDIAIQYEQFSKIAYEYADFMLKQRIKEI